ncbi:MAG TPA: TolC family protein [Gemmatimonadales bacterium]|nr:TolC family protein [Gemmatimonadales bacterium]
MKAVVMLASALALGSVAPLAGQDSVPVVTLSDALARATRLDPDYVRALGQIDNAEWSRRAARLAFIVPSITAELDATKYSTEFFNVGTSQPQSTAVNSRLVGSYELFRWGKFTDLVASKAELESAQAGELEQRFRTALLVESDFYGVLAVQELTRVSEQRLKRADDQLAVGRTRVVSGAAVQSDSLQLVLEVTRARIDLTRQRAALRVAQLQLGRRIGADGPVGAARGDSVPPPELPIELPAAVIEALQQGPQYRVARANERQAAALLRGRRGDYLPTVTVSGGNFTFDSKFFPSARNVQSMALTVSLPVWDLGSREVGITQARVNRDVARAIRADLERGAARDVTEAYEAYRTSRATVDLSGAALAAATENFRVQDARYRGGATTIIELLDAQISLTQAEADLVQANYATRLALAGLEAILGRRLFPNKDAQ